MADDNDEADGAIIDGSYYPFTTELDYFTPIENDVLHDVNIIIWPNGGYDGGRGEHRKENCRVEMCVFYNDEPSSVDLLTLLRANLRATECGKNAGIIAITKLRDGVEEILQEMIRGER